MVGFVLSLRNHNPAGNDAYICAIWHFYIRKDSVICHPELAEGSQAPNNA